MALLGDLAAVEDDDAVGMLYGREAVSDNKGGAVSGKLCQRLLDLALGLSVQSRGGLIHNQNGGIFQEYSRDRQALLLPARKLDTAFADDCIQSFRKGCDYPIEPGSLHSLDDVRLWRVQLAIGDVLADRSTEQKHILLHYANLAAKRREGHIADVNSIDLD